MDYSEIDEYTGEKTACDNCERAFEPGEVITVDTRKGYAFCYSDSMGGCAIAHTLAAGEVMIGTPMRFGGSPVLRPENPTPNYPNTPIDREKIKHFQWLRKLLNW